MTSRRTASQSANLEREIGRLAREHPEYVVHEIDGRTYPAWAVNPRPARRHGGNYDSLDEPEIRKRWVQAVGSFPRKPPPTMQAIALRMGVGKRTAERWKSTYGLRVGDES